MIRYVLIGLWTEYKMFSVCVVSKEAKKKTKRFNLKMI